MQLSKKLKGSCHISNLNKNVKILKKRMSLTAYAFPK